MKTYSNYEELLQENEVLAKELLNVKGEGDWQEEDIYQYEGKEEFAEHELTDGWYSDMEMFDRNYNGAPDPMDYIDMKALGEALTESWDESQNYLSENGTILTTSHGW